MKQLVKILMMAFVLAIPSISVAGLLYNADHDKALKNLHSVESANTTMHFQCGKHSLFITAFATQSGVNGRKASVTGKITSDESSHDISEMLERAISRTDILQGKMSVGCNSEFGAFEITYSPNAYSEETEGGKAVINVFADGTVEGVREF